jgi:hypothetical protein
MNSSVHVFAGRFKDEEEASTYTEARWHPERDESVSDEEYAAWEARNPHWRLRSDLDGYLDSDFIETITGPERYSYLEKLLVTRGDLARIMAVDPEANTRVLIFQEALGGFEVEMKSTERLSYCGG